MPLNLDKLQAQQNQQRLHPRDIFASLPNPPFTRLRLEQGEVLNKWFDRRQERDLVIKQNTGGGKTAVGLLVAQSSINEGVGPVAYLVPDTYLVKQVVDEAEALGLRITSDARSHEFRAGQEILIATFDKVVNGHTVFGLAGSAEPVILGTVIVDDAHAAIARAQDKFRIHLPATVRVGGTTQLSPAFASLLALFADDLSQQNHKNFLELQAGGRPAPMRIPFWAWAARQTQVIEILRPLADLKDSGVYWPWPLVSDHLLTATATFAARELEIMPMCPPIAMVPAFHQAKRRVYLTATLADDGILVTELDADPESVRKPITPDRAADLGDRLILAPLALNPNMVEDTVRQMVRSFADGDWDGDGQKDHEPNNVVVIVPGDNAASAWLPYANETLHVGDMKPVVDRMPSEHVGVVVLVNKYDGVDLPGKACRVLVLDGIPTPLTPSEMRESAALSGSAAFRAAKVQRIEQGMGRGIRDADDYCAVLLLGNGLALSQVEPASLALFSPATRAQIELSQGLSSQIKGEGVASLREALGMFLRRDESWLKLSRGATSAVQYEQEGKVSDLAVARRNAFDAAESGDFATAADLLSHTANALTDLGEKGWVLEESATYRHQVDVGRAQATQKAAKGFNKLLLLPTAAVPYKPLRANAAQARAASDHLVSQYKSGPELILGIDAILAEITWDPELTDHAEDAVRRLGEHLGFVSTRPDRERNEGPDNLWVMTDAHHAVIEAKTGITRDDKRVVKSEADQLSGALNWHVMSYPDVTERTPVLIHPSTGTQHGAVPPAGTRIITADDLDRLREDVRQYAREVAEVEGWKKPDTVQKALQAKNLVPGTIIHSHSSKVDNPT